MSQEKALYLWNSIQYGTLGQYKCRNLFIVSVKLDFQNKIHKTPKTITGLWLWK